MIACIQRVSRASITVKGETVASIDRGILILAGIEKGDDGSSFKRAADKIVHLRIFDDDEGKMNRDILQSGGEILIVSQFTLAGSIRRGRRPSFDGAASPEEAAPLFDRLVSELQNHPVPVQTGRFQAVMEVELVNDGPVTFLGQW